jgi:hypothetical protein
MSSDITTKQETLPAQKGPSSNTLAFAAFGIGIGIALGSSAVFGPNWAMLSGPFGGVVSFCGLHLFRDQLRDQSDVD